MAAVSYMPILNESDVGMSLWHVPTFLSEETGLCHNCEVSELLLRLGITEWSENSQRITIRIKYPTVKIIISENPFISITPKAPTK